MELVDVVLVSPGPKPTDVVMAIRDATCDEPVVKMMDLREALRRVETSPCVVVPNIPSDAGARIKATLERAGATVELRPA
jgi:ribosomal protein L7/L12